jgi:hypothetical protein
LKKRAAFLFVMAGVMIGIGISRQAFVSLSLVIVKSKNISRGTLSGN